MALQTYSEAVESKDLTPFIIFIGDKEFKGQFANVRIKRDSIPAGYHVYDLRHDDSGGEIIEICNGYIQVNHMGSFVTESDLGIEEGKSLFRSSEEDDDENDEFDYSF